MSTPLEALVGNMTIAELAERSGKSVSSIVGWALGDQGGRRAATTNGKPRATPAASGKSVDTRTPTGRKAYDEAVLAAVQSSKQPIGAGEIRSKIGGTALQARTALNRLIEQGQINYQGRARATRYTAP